MWPKNNRQKACLPCTGKCIKCMFNGESVTQSVLWRTGGSPSKRHQVAMLKVLVLHSDTTRVWKMLKGNWSEQALWAITCSLEHLVGEQVGI